MHSIAFASEQQCFDTAGGALIIGSATDASSYYGRTSEYYTDPFILNWSGSCPGTYRKAVPSIGPFSVRDANGRFAVMFYEHIYSYGHVGSGTSLRCVDPIVHNFKWVGNADGSSVSGTGAFCVTKSDDTISLTLTPAPNQTPPDPRPAGTEGKDPKSSTHELIAKVMEGSMPKAGVAVSFGVEVEANSGGHDHHDASRPKGKVTANNPATDANGEIKVTFQASKIAGTHVVAAVCESCTNKSVTKNVDVKVPDLVSLQAGRGYILQGNTSEVGMKHKGNHYFTVTAAENLQELIRFFNSLNWNPVGIDDASIVWGGKFDLKSRWGAEYIGNDGKPKEEAHQEHRIGEEVDIGFVIGTKATSISKAYYEVCREKKVDIPSTILWHDIPPNEGGKYPLHFHVRLDGTFTQGASAGKNAKCKRDSGKE